MSLKVSDLIVYPSRATVADVLDALQKHLGYIPDGATPFLNALHWYATRKGIDFSVIASHSANETNFWRDDRFQTKRDGFGIAVYGDGSPGASFATYDDAAFYAVAEYCLKLGIHLTDDEQERAMRINITKVARVVKLVARPDFPKVTRISDLNKPFGDNDFVWMADSNGPEAIVEKSRVLFPNVPDQIEQETPPMAVLKYGLVPHPSFQDRLITNKPAGQGWDDLGQRNPYGVVLHRMLGTLRGTDSYFRQAGVGALTDFGVGVAGPDAAADDGVIMRWNDPRGRRAGWASGPVSAPYGDGLAFVNKFGVNAVNRDLVSIEISGFENTPLTGKARRAIVGLMAYYADQAEVAWDQYPIGPDGFSVVIWHEELTLGTGKRCPFDEVKEQTPSLIEDTRAELKRYQVQDTPTTTTTPAPNPPEPTYPAKRVPGPEKIEHLGVKLTRNDKTRFLCRQGGQFKTFPDADAPDATKTPYKAGRTYTFEYGTPDEDWLFAKSGSWAPSKNFEKLVK